MGGVTLTGIGGVLSCAHAPVNADVFGGEVHGHSYEITAWFEGGGDARVYQVALHALLKQWDHKTLPENMMTGEAIARAVGTLANVVEVEVRRPLERIYAKWQVSSIRDYPRDGGYPTPLHITGDDHD